MSIGPFGRGNWPSVQQTFMAVYRPLLDGSVASSRLVLPKVKFATPESLLEPLWRTT
jgi:hypothetical protein